MLIETQRVAPGSSELFAFRHEGDGRATHVPAAGLAGNPLAKRFCFWRGRSGRRYVFSVYRVGPPADLEAELPRYTDAVVIAAKRAADGSCRIVDLGETGCLPELAPVIAGVVGTQRSAADELHFHLLAGGAAERRAILRDLVGASSR